MGVRKRKMRLKNRIVRVDKIWYYLGKDFILRKCLLASSNILGAKIRPFNLLRFSSTVNVNGRPHNVIVFSSLFINKMLGI